MDNEQTRLRELLAHYGADVSSWPGKVRQEGLRALKRPELAAIIAEEQRFEALLWARPLPQPSYDFTQRIIAAAYARTPIPQVAGWFHEVLSEVRPAALAAMLVVAFVIGFTLQMPSSEPHQIAAVPTLTDDEGAIL